jgi:hypothetical protein
MAEVGNIFPKNAPEQLNKMTTGLNSTNDATKALLETTRQLAEVLKQSDITYVKLVEAQKGAVKVSNELTKTEDRIKKNAEKINQLNENRAKTEAAQKVAILAKNKALKDGARLEAANSKVQKENIIIAKAQKGAYDAITAALTKNVAKWKSLTKEQRENSSVGKRLTAAIKRQDAELKKLDSTIGRSQRNVGNYGSALKGVASNLLGAFGVVGGLALFARAMKGAFSTLRSFTKESAVLAGVLGKTRNEVEGLIEQSIELGSVYPVTASEVVKLQVSFARLGFTMDEIQNLTEATILGSIALNAELDATATLVGAVVKAYASLGTSDAQSIIDQLTLSTQRSSLSFSGLETALPKVAAAASAMNVPLSKTLALLGIAQDATLDASISGTSLRNIFLEIAKEGITLDEALTRINSSQNKLTAAYDLFGKRGAIVGLALANNIDKIGEFDEAIQDAGGTAESVAEVQMKTMDGAIKGLESSWEKAMLGFRESEGFLSKLFNGIADILDRSTLKYVSNEEAFRIHQRTLNKTSNKTALDVEQDYRDQLQGVRDASNQQELQEISNQHEFLLGENEIFDKDFLKAVEDRFVSLDKEQKDSIAKSTKTLNDARVVELVAEDERVEAARVRSKKLAKIWADEIGERIALEQDFRDQQKSDTEEEEALLDSPIASETAKEDAKLNKEVESSLEAGKKINENSEKLREDADAKELSDLEEKEATKRAIIDASFQALSAIGDAFTERKVSNLQKEFDVLMLQKEAELSAEGLSAEEKQKIEEKFAKKAAEIKTKQAKAEKRAALSSIIINTALAVSKAWGQTGIFGLVAQIPVLAMGVLQLGIAASQKIPEFAKGTENAPGTGFIAGEAGFERMTLSSGEVMMIDKPTYFKGSKFKGATIDSNEETRKIIAQSQAQNIINFDTEELKRENKKNTNRIVRAISQDKSRQNRAISNAYKNQYL